jgi:hypothetical protein
MSNLRSGFGLKLVLVALAVALCGAALSIGPLTAAPQPCCGHATLVTYYSDASHTTRVGWCSFPCGSDPTCSGRQTQYSTTKQLQCCIC